MRYIPHTEADRRAMLRTIGVSSVEDLFADIPQAVKDRFRPLGLPARSEMEVSFLLAELASLNGDPSGAVSFLGGGIYDHYIPSVVSHITSRSEFYTAYTPYQPEVSQGTLAAMFEFQTLVCELVGMEVANASLYDGATSVAEAALMAARTVGERRIAVARSLFSHFRRVLDTYSQAAGIEVVEVPYTVAGRLDRAAIPEGLAGLIVQSPNAFGVIEELEGLKDRLGEAFLIVACHPLSLGILAPPGEFAADVVVAEGQPLGLSPSFGGPLLGLFATRERYVRQMPGRIAGQTVDAEGKPGYTLAVQTREQHIRRERATSNICTNSALCALAAAVYLVTVGAEGLAEVARLNLEKAHYLAERLTHLPGYGLAFDAPFFNEFVLRVPSDPERIRSRLAEGGILVEDPRPLARFGLPRALRLAVTERRTKEELDRLASLLERTR